MNKLASRALTHCLLGSKQRKETIGHTIACLRYCCQPISVSGMSNSVVSFRLVIEMVSTSLALLMYYHQRYAFYIYGYVPS